MQVTIFGASGKVGQLTVAAARAEGHSVVAFVHASNPFAGDSSIQVVQGDIHVPADIAKALQGSQAVISALGSWHTKRKDVLSVAMTSIIPVMTEQGISRIVTLTGSAAFDSTDTVSLDQRLLHFVFGCIAPRIQKDGEQHIRVLRASNLNWTTIRSPGMTTFGSPMYVLRTKLPSVFRTIQRRAVAQALVDQLEATDFIHAAPAIFRA
jgi:putative NADH-flavin reductase